MGNVVRFIDRKKPVITNEQRLKLYCIKTLMVDDDLADEMVQTFGIDGAFTFLADKAVEWELIKGGGELS